MNRKGFETLLQGVHYKDWQFIVADAGDTLFLQCRFYARGAVSGEVEAQRSRKWLLSTHMTPSEVIQTAFKAVLTAEEHEARENFKFHGEAIYGPHFHVVDLVKLAATGHRDTRDAVAADHGGSQTVIAQSQ